MITIKKLILLSHQLNKLYIDHVNPDETCLFLTQEQFTYYKYHQNRIIYHISAAKHFVKDLSINLVDKETFDASFKTCDQSVNYVMFHPNDYWLKKRLDEAIDNHNITVKFLPDINFFYPQILKEMPESPYKLDPIYKKWRKQTGILMNQGEPIGKRYSFDQANRNSPPKTLETNDVLTFEQDQLTKEVIDAVKKTYPNHPQSDIAFNYPVTKDEALKALKHFIENRLEDYGKYQDAMMEEAPFMAHSLLSAPINLGLLTAVEVVRAVEKSYYEQGKPIEAVEGFIRQVLGWREYVRGVYFKEITNNYTEKNHLNHEIDKPPFLYDANIDLNCLSTVIKETIDYGYNHHIQRLMIIGNITNLLGINPKAIREWFNEMYIDSFDYIVTPNVIGMAMYADGGLMSTKPYIASANYINKMSNYCKNCYYDPKAKTNDKACPVNLLYYDFLKRHKETLKDNPRMKFMYANLNKLNPETLSVMDELLSKWKEKN